MSATLFCETYRADTVTGEIYSKATGQLVARYTLERKRSWNVGLRRHHMALTGRIELVTLDSGAYRAFPDWDSMVPRLDEMAKAIGLA